MEVEVVNNLSCTGLVDDLKLPVGTGRGLLLLSQSVMAGMALVGGEVAPLTLSSL